MIKGPEEYKPTEEIYWDIVLSVSYKIHLLLEGSISKISECLYHPFRKKYVELNKKKYVISKLLYCWVFGSYSKKKIECKFGFKSCINPQHNKQSKIKRR